MKNSGQLWTVAIGRGVSLLGDEMALVALSLRLQGSGASPLSIAALFVAGLLPLVALAGPVGRLVDRADSRALLLSSSACQAGLCLALAYTDSRLAVLVLVTALGCGEAVNGATWQALVPSIVGASGIGQATGILQAVRTGASIVAPALAGTLAGVFGTRVPLLVDFGTYLAITVTALTVRTRRQVAAGGDEKGGWAIVRADRLLRTLLALMATFVMLGASVVVVEVFLIRETLHASATWYGIALAVWGVGMLAGALGGGRWLRSDLVLVRSLLAGMAGLSVSMIGFALCGDMAALIALSVVGGVANGIVNFAGTTLISSRPEPSQRGRVAAVASGVLSGSQIAAFALGGTAGAFLTPREVYWAGGLLGLVGPVLLGRALLRAVAPQVRYAEAGLSSQAA